MASTPTYAVSGGFLGLPVGHRQSAFEIVGIPLDLGVTNRAGTREGPAAVRRASRMLTDGDHPHFWIDPARLDITDSGDIPLALGDLAASLSLIEQRAATARHLIAIGGEHGVSLALLRALRAKIGVPLALIHFDAHVDTWPDNFGQVYGHGSPFFHAINEGLIDPRRTIQIGIRSPVQREVWDWTVNAGVTIITAQDVHAMGPRTVIERIHAVVGTAPAYVTYDVDCLDPAFAPGTGTPEVAGLFPWQTQAILRGLGGIDFRGLDVVEVAPAYDIAEITALAAATVIWDYLGLVGSQAR